MHGLKICAIPVDLARSRGRGPHLVGSGHWPVVASPSLPSACRLSPPLSSPWASTTLPVVATESRLVGRRLRGTRMFLVVGLWHVWSAAVRYAADPPGFKCRAWSPVGKGRLRHLELWVVAGGALLDMGIELSYSTHLNFFVGEGGDLEPCSYE